MTIIANVRKRIKRMFEWEHWSVYFFYIPLLPYAFYESLKSRSFCFFYSANPGIFHSGSGVESKYATLLKVPKEYRPKMAIVPKNSKLELVASILKGEDLNFPLIGKPDVGYRGYLVKRLQNIDEVIAYLKKFNEIDIIFQEFVTYSYECGVFYTKRPSEATGNISSLTLKKFLVIVGDGHSTVEELINQDKKASSYAEEFINIHREGLGVVLKDNEQFQLTIVGNHSKGTQFVNGNHLIDDELIKSIDSICQQIEGFNYGRLDIKYKSLEELKQGEKIRILEVNGIISEPTHVFDTSSEDSSYWKVLQTQKYHWGLLSDIAREHHLLNNVPYHSFWTFISDMFWIRKYSKKLKFLNKL